MFHPLRDPQLQFKSEKYKLNKNMKDIIKQNIKKNKINNKNLITQKQEIRQVTYMLTYTKCKTFNFGKQYQLKNCIDLTKTYKGFEQLL